MVVSHLDTPLRALTADPTRSVPAHTDAQEVLALFRKYGLLSLAVVADGGKLLGAVTVDDALKLASRG
jgi:magnesium transporter